MATVYFFSITILALGVILILKKLRETDSLSFFDFFKRVRSGAAFRDIEPAELQETLMRNGYAPLIIDLRERELFEKGHLAKAISLPFNDFMHAALVEEEYEKETSMVLICDHGLKSKVAADIIGEDEGFSSVLSLRGGMAAWEKYKQPLPSFQCCPGFLL